MRPLIHPALVRVWRDPTTIQIGLDPARALVLGGLTTLDATVLRSLDGRADTFMLRSLATDQTGDAGVADRLLDVLQSAGVLVDCDRLQPADRPDAPQVGERAQEVGERPGESDVRAPDRASIGILTGAIDGGAAAMQARSAAWVEVRGAGRVGAQIVRLLDAAGVGRTSAVDPGPVSAHDVAPGGQSARHIGRPRGETIQRFIAGTPARPRATGMRPPASEADQPTPDFVVLTPAAGTPVVQGGEALVAAGIPHLAARVVELTGIVGPLVVPGRTSCLRCLELHRGDRDPAWPRIAAQAAHRGSTVAACDVTLATQVAALAAQQVLASLDGFSPATVDGTIEVSLPYGLPRRRSWHPHPACGCAWT